MFLKFNLNNYSLTLNKAFYLAFLEQIQQRTQLKWFDRFVHLEQICSVVVETFIFNIYVLTSQQVSYLLRCRWHCIHMLTNANNWYMNWFCCTDSLLCFEILFTITHLGTALSSNNLFLLLLSSITRPTGLSSFLFAQNLHLETQREGLFIRAFTPLISSFCLSWISWIILIASCTFL